MSEEAANASAQINTQGGDKSTNETPAVETKEQGTVLTQETKANEESNAEADKSAEAEGTENKNEAGGVPDKYDLKLPENSVLDAAALERVASFAKERGLNQDQAQAVLEREQETVQAVFEAQKAELSRKSEQWVEQIKSDKEIGGDMFKQNAELASRFITKFAPPELKQTLNETGLGNHPALFKFVLNAAKQMSEDQLVTAQAHGSQARPIEEIFYGKQEI